MPPDQPKSLPLGKEATIASAFFRQQLASYAAVHLDQRNKITHFVGIPLIVFSLLLVLTLWHVPPAADMSAGLVVAVIAVLGWLALDIGIGLVLAVVMLPTWYAARALADALGTPTSIWTAFAVLFIGGWILQFVGHHYEGKRPALLDNLFQAFIAPMFLVAEILVLRGMRPDLAALMGDRVGHGSVTSR